MSAPEVVIDLRSTTPPPSILASQHQQSLVQQIQILQQEQGSQVRRSSLTIGHSIRTD